MQRQCRPTRITLIAALVLGSTATVNARGDDDQPRGLGRLFRFGGRNQSARDAESRKTPRTETAESVPPPITDPDVADPSRLLRNSRGMAATPGSTSLAPYSSLPGARSASNPQPNPAAPHLDPVPNDVGAPASPGVSSGPRLVPQPRTARPATEAPPLLSRVQIGRSDDGRQFGMFLQIYSDGTVVDTEGVHKVGRDVLAPLVEALRAGDAGRIRGHCGSPPVDYVEHVMVIVYDNSRGRLQANSFSYSGNTQGCSPAIRNIQAAIDAVQAKISPTPATTTTNTEPEPTPQPYVDPATIGPEADAAPAPPLLSAPATPSPAPPLQITPTSGP